MPYMYTETKAFHQTTTWRKKAIYDMEINGPHQHWKMPQVVWNFLNTVDSYFTPVCMST